MILGGRLYTLSNYLSYQGDDLSRSLLLFHINKECGSEGSEAYGSVGNAAFGTLGKGCQGEGKKISKKDALSTEGYKYLLFYFANLAGKKI